MARNKVTYAKVSITNIRRAITNYEEKYFFAMKKLMRDAAAVFVKTAVAHVHVDTGMSAASLEIMARKAGTSILGSFSPRRIRKGAMTMSSASGRGIYMPKRFRSVKEGIRAGQTASTFSSGTRARPIMSFRFQIKVWQYWYWEANWQSLNEAAIDAEIFIENNYERYLPEGLDEVFKYGSPNVSY